MGLYSKMAAAGGSSGISSPAFMTDEFDRIETALSSGNDYQIYTMEVVANKTNVANTDIQDNIVIPYACTITHISAVAGTATQTGGAPSFEVWNQTGTPAIVHTAKTITAANTATAAVLTVPAVAANDILTLRLVVNAAGAALAKTKVTIVTKKTLAA